MPAALRFQPIRWPHSRSCSARFAALPRTGRPGRGRSGIPMKVALRLGSLCQLRAQAARPIKATLLACRLRGLAMWAGRTAVPALSAARCGGGLRRVTRARRTGRSRRRVTRLAAVCAGMPEPLRLHGTARAGSTPNQVHAADPIARFQAPAEVPRIVGSVQRIVADERYGAARARPIGRKRDRAGKIGCTISLYPVEAGLEHVGVPAAQSGRQCP